MSKYTLWGIIFSTVLGTLLHFAYDFLGQNAVVGIFSATNESIWEHLKLLFYPVLIYSIFEFFIAKQSVDFIPARVQGLLIGISFIVTAYYTYSGVLGKNYDFVNILIFVLSVIITFISSNIFLKNGGNTTVISIFIWLVVLVVLAVLFSIFTFNPPSINIFIDPSK